jgi:regulator of protease activity HflC (stomatin/prohibitin superfamily)
VIPGFDSIKVVDLRVRTVDIEPQESMTRDNVTVRVNAVVYYKVMEPEKAVNVVEDYDFATSRGAQTTLRNVIGQYMLDDLLKNRNTINSRLRQIIDEMTDPWGIKVEQVEIKDLEIPTALQRAMAKEAEAEREKRARLIRAQGELEASKKGKAAADEICENPAVLELRRMQMVTEIGVDQNTTTVVLMPTEFVTFAQSITDLTKTISPKKNNDNKLFVEDPMLEVG